MTDQELIGKIKELNQIKPKKEWVLLTKEQILGKEAERVLFPFSKPVYAGLFLLLFLTGLFETSQAALPGELLYPLKKITEKGRTLFASEEKKPGVNLELANRRLEELVKIAEANQVKKLAPAVNEFKESLSQAAKNLTETQKITDVKIIVQKTQELAKNKEIAERILATKIETEELDNALSKIVSEQIKDLENRTLTEKGEEALTKAKEYFESENYDLALIEILNIVQENQKE